MSETSKTQAEIAMAAAVAKQAEATASQLVADTTAAESKANPNDANLLLVVAATQAEATKDQLAADEALAYAIFLDTEETAPAVITPPVITEPIKEEPVIVTPIKTVSGSVIKETKPVVAVASNKVVSVAVADTGFAGLVSKYKETGTLAERTLIVQLEQYIDAMMPGKPVTPEAGARSQHALWRTILSTIERSGEEFKSVYSILLAYFEEYKNGVFHERYVFRFAEMISMPSDELATFQRTLNLIKLTCSPIGRAQSLKQVDLNRTLKDVFSEQGRQQILGFYGK